jgi:hypothetical protein
VHWCELEAIREQGADHAGMGDDERVAAPIVRPRCETFADAPDEVEIGLSAPRAGAGWIGAEGRQSLGIAGFDLHRAKSLPFAKPHLRQRGQHIQRDPPLARELLGEGAAANQRRAGDGRDRRNVGDWKRRAHL